MTAARKWNNCPQSGSVIEQKETVIFMQTFGRDYRQNPPLVQEIAPANATAIQWPGIRGFASAFRGSPSCGVHFTFWGDSPWRRSAF
jgi:hypothetical protein